MLLYVLKHIKRVTFDTLIRTSTKCEFVSIVMISELVCLMAWGLLIGEINHVYLIICIIVVLKMYGIHKYREYDGV